MISIVKTLLIIAKSDKRKTESQSIFNFSNLILNEVKSYFTDNKITYEIEKDIYLRGESDKFLMLMHNLGNNAIKFSDVNGSVKIILKKIFHNVELSIEDNGIGISDDEKDKVFERFYRSERTEKFGLKGHGLGLSLVRSIVTEARGKIEIQDNIPKGTVVKIVLPALELE